MRKEDKETRKRQGGLVVGDTRMQLGANALDSTSISLLLTHSRRIKIVGKIDRRIGQQHCRNMRPVETFSIQLQRFKTLRRGGLRARAAPGGAIGKEGVDNHDNHDDDNNNKKKNNEEEEGSEGPSTDLRVIGDRLSTLALPYWTEGPQVGEARLKLAGVVALTLGTTGVSVMFSYLGRDFFNALSAKDQAKFTEMLVKWLVALSVGIPVFVLRDYYQSKLALDWREWMTNKLTVEYFEKRKFYKIQASALLDNPDQRIAVDVRCVWGNGQKKWWIDGRRRQMRTDSIQYIALCYIV